MYSRLRFRTLCYMLANLMRVNVSSFYVVSVRLCLVGPKESTSGIVVGWVWFESYVSVSLRSLSKSDGDMELWCVSVSEMSGLSSGLCWIMFSSVIKSRGELCITGVSGGCTRGGPGGMVCWKRCMWCRYGHYVWRTC